VNITVIDSAAPMTLPAIDFIVLKDLPSLLLNFKIGQVNCEALVNHTINLCSMERSRRANIFIRLIMDTILRNFDIQLKCPIKKGLQVHLNERSYAKTNAEIVRYIPSFVGHGDPVRVTIVGTMRESSRSVVRILTSTDTWQLVDELL